MTQAFLLLLSVACGLFLGSALVFLLVVLTPAQCCLFVFVLLLLGFVSHVSEYVKK